MSAISVVIIFLITNIFKNYTATFGFYTQRTPQGFITNGMSAYYGYFPYQAALTFYNADYETEFCGGFLISRNYLLTAAHCAIDTKGAIVYLGTTNLTNVKDQENVYSYHVKAENITVHPKFSVETYHNDIAVVKIKPVDFAKYRQIRPVALPKVENFEIANGLKVNSSGFGLTSDNSTEISQQLEFVTLEVTDPLLCQKVYNNSHNSCQICVKTENGKSSCVGDSGGPLTTADNVAIGIVSYGSSVGCEINYPVVYTRISCYLEWINEVIIGNE